MKQSNCYALLAALLAIEIFVLSGCCDPLAFLGGNLSIRLESSSRNLTLLPELDMDIVSYTITGTGPRGAGFTEEDYNWYYYLKFQLAVGEWEVSVDGFNAGGTRVGTASVKLTIRRSQTTEVTVTLRPLAGTGMFSGTVSWTDDLETLSAPQVWMVVRGEDGTDMEDVSVPMRLEVVGMVASWSFELPVGWYEVTVGLYEGVPGDGALVVRQRVYILRIVRGQTTNVILAIPETDTYSIPMVYVEGETFEMVTPSGAYSDERSVHMVTVDSFYMGKYEVTQNINELVTGSHPSDFKGFHLPVEAVIWYDALAFANALS